MRDQVTPRSQLSSEEKVVFQLVDELPRGMNCRELIALIGEDGVLRKKGLDMDALIRRAKGISSAEPVSTQKESAAVEVVSVSSFAEKEPLTFVAKEESANPVAEKELVEAPTITEELSASLVVGDGPVQTSERLMPEGPNKRKATTPIVEEVPGKKGKGIMSSPISQGQLRGKVIVTSGPKLPLGGLSCYTAPSGTNSMGA
ncbi:hypothetical protein CR513_02630, partial [Mucuna pruriens]